MRGIDTSPLARSFALILPVYNGAHVLPETLATAWEWLRARDARSELIVVDDGSTDATPRIAEEFAAAHAGQPGPRLRLLRNDRNRGKGYSVGRGFRAAETDDVVFTDVDLTYPLDSIDGLLRALADGADVAIGSRMHRDSRYVVAPSFFGYLFTRHFSGRVFNRLSRWFVVPGVLDTQAGLKAAQRRVACRLVRMGRLHRFSFDLEYLFLARRLGLSIVECPVTFIYRKEPSTTRFLRDTLRMLHDMTRIRWRALRGGYTEPAAETVAEVRVP